MNREPAVVINGRLVDTRWLVQQERNRQLEQWSLIDDAEQQTATQGVSA